MTAMTSLMMPMIKLQMIPRLHTTLILIKMAMETQTQQPLPVMLPKDLLQTTLTSTTLMLTNTQEQHAHGPTQQMPNFHVVLHMMLLVLAKQLMMTPMEFAMMPTSVQVKTITSMRMKMEPQTV
jgi:hypothetical protein